MKTKSEVIKLMKEGTHCIYNDCVEKLNLLNEILSKSTDRETGVGGMHLYYWIGRNKARCLNNNRPELDIIRLSEIEPDNEKAQAIFKEKYFSNDTVDMINKMFQLLDNKNEKPYLFYEGEKYYFGEEYELSCDKEEWIQRKFVAFESTEKYPFCTDVDGFKHIRKIDHATKYKKLLLELKEQAEKDGVNLKELI